MRPSVRFKFFGSKLENGYLYYGLSTSLQVVVDELLIELVIAPPIHPNSHVMFP